MKDENFYLDVGDQGAIEVHFLSTGSTLISKAQWDSIREGMFCMSAEAIGDFKSEIEQLCQETSCDQQAQFNIKQAFDHIESAENSRPRRILP